MSCNRIHLFPTGPANERGETHVVRIENGVQSEGVIGPIKDGQPIPPGVEVLDLDGCHATSIYKAGPVQVATKEYRDGWERCFNSN